MQIRVLVGLGNPGSEYTATRHNIGFRLLDALAAQMGIQWKAEKKMKAEVARGSLQGNDLWLLKPQTFMNASGESLIRFAGFHKIPPTSFLVIYDEIQFEPGQIKLSMKGSDGGHNGVADIRRRLGDGFARLRVGVGARRHPEMDLKDHVLSRFLPEEELLIGARMPALLDALTTIVRQGPARAMNQINRKH